MHDTYIIARAAFKQAGIIQENVFQGFESDKKAYTILGYYKSCLKKIDLYRKKIQYGTGEWKKLIIKKHRQ